MKLEKNKKNFLKIENHTKTKKGVIDMGYTIHNEKITKCPYCNKFISICYDTGIWDVIHDLEIQKADEIYKNKERSD